MFFIAGAANQFLNRKNVFNNLTPSDVHLEGIFRKCGSKKRINDIRKLLDSHGNVIDWSDQEVFTVHDAASVLKQYLAELPSPLLSGKHIPVHIEIASKSWLL